MTTKVIRLINKNSFIQDTIALPKPARITIVLWLLFMVSLPIINWISGDAALRQGLVFAVILQTTAVFFILKTSWTWQKIFTIFTIIALLTLLIEMIGARTGIPFGHYHYTSYIQPQIGHVPLLIPLAWFMMLPPSWAVASHFHRHPFQFAAMSALALTAWDLLLDPQMVLWQLWVWDQPGAYFGIPLLNYLGWFLTAFGLTWILRPYIKTGMNKRPLLIIYSITWFLETFGLLFFWGLVGPAIIGGIGMGACMWFGWRHLK